MAVSSQRRIPVKRLEEGLVGECSRVTDILMPQTISHRPCAALHMSSSPSRTPAARMLACRPCSCRSNSRAGRAMCILCSVPCRPPWLCLRPSRLQEPSESILAGWILPTSASHSKRSSTPGSPSEQPMALLVPSCRRLESISMHGRWIQVSRLPTAEFS